MITPNILMDERVILIRKFVNQCDLQTGRPYEKQERSNTMIGTFRISFNWT